MSLVLCLPLIVIIWSSIGFFVYLMSSNLIKKAKKNKKFFRVFIFNVLCGPIVILLYIINLLIMIGTISVYYILQEVPDDLEKKK